MQGSRLQRWGRFACLFRILSCWAADSLEILAVEVLTPKPIIISLVYIPPPPTISYLSLFDYLASVAVNKDLILLGDFNSPDIVWPSLSSDSHSSLMLCDFAFDNSLLQLVHESTHEKGNILDLVFTSCPACISNIEVHSNIYPLLVSSDHYPITFLLPVVFLILSPTPFIPLTFPKVII